MRSFFYSWLAVISPWFCTAQELTPAVTNMAGFNVTQGTTVVSVSIGEPAITTLSTSKTFITQGLLQPEILPCVDLEFSYYPNPAIREITIEAFGCETNIESMQLITLWGQVITTIAPRKDNKVSLDGLGEGLYLMKVKMTSGSYKTIKIFKVNH